MSVKKVAIIDTDPNRSSKVLGVTSLRISPIYILAPSTMVVNIKTYDIEDQSELIKSLDKMIVVCKDESQDPGPIKVEVLKRRKQLRESRSHKLLKNK